MMIDALSLFFLARRICLSILASITLRILMGDTGRVLQALSAAAFFSGFSI